MPGDMREYLTSLLERGVRDNVFPGAVAGVIDGARGTVTLSKAGWLHAAERSASSVVTLHTAYDLASITKSIVAAATHVQLDAAGIQLNSVAIDDFTWAELLSHTSGLQAWSDLYAQTPYAGDSGRTRRWIGERARVLRVDGQRGQTVYSDLGYIALTVALEARFGPLEDWVLSTLQAHVGHQVAIRYGAVSSATEVAPTEYDGAYRHRMVQGEVHDENAFAMGGISAHAGMFGTLDGMLAFSGWLLGLAASGCSWLVAATRPYSNGSYGLGFDTKRGAEHGVERGVEHSGQRAFGTKLSDRTFGHLGFTGTSYCIDPQQQLAMVLLTNRVHPSRDNIGIRMFRPYFHDAIADFHASR